MRKPDRFTVIRTPVACWSAALDALRAAGTDGCELMLYFIGTVAGTEGDVTRIVVPRQRRSAVDCEPDMAEIVRITSEIVDRGEALLWQLHSHPSSAFLSGTDRTYPASHKLGWFSAVAPAFGAGIGNDLADVRVFERRGVTSWDELDRVSKAERLPLVP
jgi:proteasome lid subunit RPN8/RPN11